MDEEIRNLLKKGVAAAKQGDHETARKIFEQVIEQDDENVTAWLWLYRVVDDPDEKRICLTTVLQLDPENETAQKLLIKLDTQRKTSRANEEVLPGVTRRQLQLAGLAIAVVVVLLLVIIIAITGQNRARQAAEATQVAILQRAPTETLQARETATQEAATNLTATAEIVMATQLALASPTPSPSPTRSVELPPTWTPAQSPTPTPTVFVRPTALPAPQLPGIISGWGGRDLLNNGFLEARVYELQGGANNFTTITDDPAQHVIIDPRDGLRLIYTQSFTMGGTGLFAINRNGSQPDALSAQWIRTQAILDPQMPRWSFDGTQIVFVAQAQDTLTQEIYMFNLSGGFARITTDQATYTWPSLSPDGSQIAAIRNDIGGATPGPDIVIISVSRPDVQRALTTDFNSIIEEAPVWSPDGLQIAYAAAQSNNPNQFDIYVRLADGTGTPTKITSEASGSDNRFPVFSPDGRYLAFASNRNGNYEIYIYEFATGQVWQVTDNLEDDFPYAWVN